MSEDYTENLDSTNETEEETVENPEGETSEERLARLEEQNKKLFARAKKAEGYSQDSDGNWVKKEQPKPKQTITKKPIDLDEEKFELRLQGYSKEDVNFILNNGGSDALSDKNSLVSLALSEKKKQANAENAAQQTTNTSGMSEVERKYTPEQLKNMSSKELEKILPATGE